MGPFVSCIYLTYCMEYVWKSSLWIGRVYFKKLLNEQEYYWPTINRAGAAVVSTITSSHYIGSFSWRLACVASVSVWFGSKERPRNRILGFGRKRNKRRAKKWNWGEGKGEGEGEGEVSFLSSPPPPRSFTYAVFRAIFDYRSSFFAPKPQGNACYAGYVAPRKAIRLVWTEHHLLASHWACKY